MGSVHGKTPDEMAVQELKEEILVQKEVVQEKSFEKEGLMEAGPGPT